MTSIERTIAEVLGACALVLAFVLYEQHVGAEKCLNKDAAVAAKQEQAVATRQAVATNTITLESKAYVEAKLVPITDAPDVTCVRHTSGAVLPAATPGPRDHAGRGLPEGDSGSVQLSPDLAKNTIAIGRDANAQVKQLKDYIYKVCLNDN